MIGYEIFTQDLRSQIQGGDPVWDGSLPCKLPKVNFDRSEVDCGAGWNYRQTPEQAIIATSLWPNGRPCRMFKIDDHGKGIVRGSKCRAESLEVVEEVTDMQKVISYFSKRFGDLQNDMAKQQ